MALETLNSTDPIAGLYDSVFKRAPDAAGLEFWKNAYNTGTSLEQIKNAFQNSQEAQANPYVNTLGGTGANLEQGFVNPNRDNALPSNVQATTQQTSLPTGTAGTTLNATQMASTVPDPNEAAITSLYDSVLKRTPDASGLAFWTQAAKNGMSLADIKSSIAASQEGTATTAVNNLYTNYTGTAPTATQLNDAKTQLSSGKTVDDVTKSLLATPTTKTSIEKLITQMYDDRLGRVPDANGLSFWSSKVLNGQMTLADVAKQIGTSSEGSTAASVANIFQQYTGKLPTPQELADAQALLRSGKTIDDVTKNLAANVANKPAVEKLVSQIYTDRLGHSPDASGLAFWTSKITAGTMTLADVAKQIGGSTESTAFQNDPVIKLYQQYVGRTPSLAESDFWRTQLSKGIPPAEIAKGIALSDEGIKYSTTNLKAILTAQIGADFVNSLTPSQITQYATLLADPSLTTRAPKLSQDQFDSNYYLAQNPDVVRNGFDPYTHYKQFGYNEGRAGSATDKIQIAKTNDDKIRDIYGQMAKDPVLGEKIKASSPLLYEAVTPLTDIGGKLINGTLNYNYGSYNDLPILNANVALAAVGDGNVMTNFSHKRGHITDNLGWQGTGYSGKILRGADAVGVTVNLDEDGNVGSYSGLNEAADLLGIDKNQFKDKQVPLLTKDVRDSDGNVVSIAGQPVYKTDGNGDYLYDDKGQLIPKMRTITAESQLYDAVDKASKSIWSVTLNSLEPGQAVEKGSRSFQTALYRQEGDKLLAISKAVSHGGVYNMDIYTGGSGFNFGRDIAPGLVFVGTAALTMATLGGSAPLTAIGAGVGLTGSAATIAGGVIVGATMGGLNASASGQDPGKGILTGAAIGGITSSMQPLMNTGPVAGVLKDVSEASGGFYTQQQLGSIVGTTLATTVGSAVKGANGDQIFEAFATSLAANGISQTGVSAITSALKDVVSPDTMAKIARATQIAGSTVATSALSGKNQEQIFNNLISQFADPTKAIGTIGSVVTAKDTTGGGTTTTGGGTTTTGGDTTTSTANDTKINDIASNFGISANDLKSILSDAPDVADKLFGTGTQVADISGTMPFGKSNVPGTEGYDPKQPTIDLPKVATDLKASLDNVPATDLSQGLNVNATHFTPTLTLQDYTNDKKTLQDQYDKKEITEEQFKKDNAALDKDFNNQTQNLTQALNLLNTLISKGMDANTALTKSAVATNLNKLDLASVITGKTNTNTQVTGTGTNTTSTVTTSTVTTGTGTGTNLTGTGTNLTGTGTNLTGTGTNLTGTGTNLTGTGTNLTGTGTNLTGTGTNLTGTGTTTPPKTVQQTSTSYAVPSSGSTTIGALPGNLQSTSLAAAPVTGTQMNLAQLKQLYPQLSNVDPRILNSLTGKKAQAPGYFTYGADSAGGTNLSMQGQGGLPSPGYPTQAADTKGLETKFAAPQSVNPNYNALSSAGLNLVNTGNLGYKDGGNVHIPQFKTGTTGHFVQGAGDGQSDDIPAMLADGEYVFDADTVAALGNGSSKAGALQLDKMRKSIRKHKRGASIDKIPPKAKSPLEYLKG